MSLFKTTLLFLGLHRAVQERDTETCANACRALMSCEAYSPQTCLALEELLGCSCPACSSDCRRRLDENKNASSPPTIPCLGELNCDDGFAGLGVTCAFLENEAVGFGAPNPCDCSLSICAQDDVTTYNAPAYAVCEEYVEDDFKARPCIALARPATDALAVKKGDALFVDGRAQRWTSSGRRPVTIEAGATLEVQSVTIDGSFSTEYFAGCIFVGAGSRFSATATTFTECKAIAMAAGGAIAAWTGSEISIKSSFLVMPSATIGGGIFLYAGADAILEASHIRLASAELRGACAYVDESATLTLRGSHFNGCSAAEGGGFFTQPGSMLQITESVVEGGFALGGGALLAYGSVYSANSTFRDSFASTYCGGLFIVGSSASFVGEDLVLRGLTTADYAAAVLGAGFGGVPPALFLRRVAVEYCHAQWGGSVAIYAGTLGLEQVVIAQGQGLNIYESTATIIGSTVTNSTEGIAGGCMWTSASVVTMIESQLMGCAAPRGGAIFAAGESHFVLRTVVIANSVAMEGSGGAALLSGSSVLDAGAVTFANCTAVDDGGAVSVVENSRVSFGGNCVLENNMAAGPGGAISVRASELYLAPRCSFVVLTSVEINARTHGGRGDVLTLDFSNGGAEYIEDAHAWLIKTERHGPEAYFDERGVLAQLSPVARTRTSLELCLEPATYELWTLSYLGDAWQDVTWELSTPFGDVRDYSETRFPGVGHPALEHGLQAARVEIAGDANEQHMVRFSRNVASGNGGAIATFDGARVLTGTGSAFHSNLAIGVGGAVFIGNLCFADLFGIEATHNGAVSGAALAASTLSTVQLQKSTLHSNIASRTGGAIFAENVEAMVLAGLKIVDNVAYVNGAAGFFDTSPVMARDVICLSNVAHENGGALAVFESHVRLEGVAFERNLAKEGSGGALYVVAGSAVDITTAPACAPVSFITDWTQTSASCSPVMEGNDWVTCDFAPDYCPSGRIKWGTDACDGCACVTLDTSAENYFEVVLANDILGTGTPRAKAIMDYQFCLRPNANMSTYRVVAYDNVRGRGWFSGKLHVAIAFEHGLTGAVENFSFDGKVGEVQFQVVEVPVTTTRFVENVAGGGGGAIFYDADVADVEIVDNVVGNSAGYGDTVATPAVSLELQLRNITLVTSSAIPFHVSAKLVDAKGQLVATNSRLVVDVYWSADVDAVEAVGTRNTTFNGVVEFDALTFMAPVGAMCRMHLESDTLRSATINVSIVACPPGYEEELRNDIAQCAPCRSNYYWHEGRCRACVDGMSCQDDGAVPLEHRIVGDIGALALKSGFHRQSVYSRRPVRCDGGKLNRACPGGIDSVGCDTKKFVMNKPRCKVCKTTYFRRRFRCLSCTQVKNTASIIANAIFAVVLLSVLVVLGPLVVRPTHDASLESEAKIRFARALRKVQTKYKALFVALQLWSVLLFTAPVELPPVTIGFLEHFRILSATIPGSCLTKRRFSLYTNLLAWTIAPFALVAFCVCINIGVNLVRSVKSSLAAIKRVDGHQQRPFVNLIYQNVFGGVRESPSRMRRFTRDDSRLIFSRRISDSQVAMAVLVIVAFLSYPPMAYVVLSFFATDTYDDPHKPDRTTSYSYFDPAIRAEGPKYLMYRTYAQICVATHVFGIPAFFAFSLHRKRDCLDPVDSEGRRPRLDPQRLAESRARCAAIAQTRVDIPELRSLRPLWFVYLPEYFNFEVLELLRRMVMMTVPKLVSRKPATQTAFVCLIAYASTRLYRQVQPFLSASDCEFFENTQWLTLILSSILLYIAAHERHDKFAGYSIILVFVTSVIHAFVLVAQDMRQEKFIAQAVTEYMSKVCDRVHRRSFAATPHRPSFSESPLKDATDSIVDSTRGDAAEEFGSDDTLESHRTVVKPGSTSKIANAEHD